MTFSEVKPLRGLPTLYLNGQPTPAVAAYVGSRYLDTFRSAGIQLYTFYVPGKWWLGPQEYDFREIDEYLSGYTAGIPGGFFMPRMDLSGQGAPWWGELHQAEMNVLRAVADGRILDPRMPDPRAAYYLGHQVDLASLNLHSFHSQVWREEAGQAIAALVAHCEAQPYADQIWGWHVCDGLFCEWFHWNEYSFDGMADYSPAAQADFRAWLRRVYQNDAGRLSSAWGRRMAFEAVEIPLPQERVRPSHGEFYNPILDRPTVDYTQCFNEAIAQSILAICQAVKSALPRPKVVCVFYGYQFSNMPRPQLNGHYALNKLLASPYVDLIASPHAYSNRGLGGYHSPQAIADSIRRAGKIHFDEIDCKTAWTPPDVTWKRHIHQPETAAQTIEMIKKDAAYALASATGLWWMDLTDQGWFEAPELVEPIRRLKAIEERLLAAGRCSFGEIALVVSQRAMLFHAPREGLHNAALKIFRQWHLSRMGAPFEQITLDDLQRPDLPAYKLYIFANLFYLSAQERAHLERMLRSNGATALWIYAPGYLDDQSASLENMQALTGMRFGMADVHGAINIHLTATDHPLTRHLPRGAAYGTGVDLDQYLRSPKIQYLPDLRFSPAFYVDDDQAQTLGTVEFGGQPTQKTGLAVKEQQGWRSIYSAAPLLPWPLMRNIARFAGVHLYSQVGDMIWANDAFVALYSQSDGRRTLRFPRKVEVEDAYTGEKLGAGLEELELELARWETRLFSIRY